MFIQLSWWCAVPRTRHPTYRKPRALVPTPHHDLAARLATHTHSTFPETSNEEPSVATGHEDLSAGMAQLLCSRTSHNLIDRWIFLQVPPLLTNTEWIELTPRRWWIESTFTQSKEMCDGYFERLLSSLTAHSTFTPGMKVSGCLSRCR